MKKQGSSTPFDSYATVLVLFTLPSWTKSIFLRLPINWWPTEFQTFQTSLLNIDSGISSVSWCLLTSFPDNVQVFIYSLLSSPTQYSRFKISSDGQMTSVSGLVEHAHGQSFNSVLQ